MDKRVIFDSVYSSMKPTKPNLVDKCSTYSTIKILYSNKISFSEKWKNCWFEISQFLFWTLISANWMTYLIIFTSFRTWKLLHIHICSIARRFLRRKLFWTFYLWYRSSVYIYIYPMTMGNSKLGNSHTPNIHICFISNNKW